MTDQADPGQVVPGTQKPIETFYVVSRTEAEPTVGEYNVNRLADLFAGTREREPIMTNEYAIFTDATSADRFATRQKLVHRATKHIANLSDAQLAEVVPALAPGTVEDTIESINRYTE